MADIESLGLLPPPRKISRGGKKKDLKMYPPPVQNPYVRPWVSEGFISINVKEMSIVNIIVQLITGLPTKNEI